MRPRLPQNIADVSTPYRSPAPYTVIVATLLVLFLGTLATVFHKPLIVPPIGPTIFIVLAFPLAQEAQPRNALCGHLLGITAGALALVIFGLLDTPPDLSDLGTSRLMAVTLAMALALTSLRVLHVPSVATALLVSLGLLREPEDWVALMVAVVMVLAVALVLARLRGVPMPLWSRSEAPRMAASEESER